MKARLAEFGGNASGIAGRFGQLIAEETVKWGKVVRAAGIKPGAQGGGASAYQVNPSWGFVHARRTTESSSAARPSPRERLSD